MRAVPLSGRTLGDGHAASMGAVAQSLAAAVRSSAEVVAEAPCCTASGGLLPLTDFGSANFTAATVNGAELCNTSPAEIVRPDVSVSAISSCGDFGVS
jgi:hypothetical protein